MLQDLCEPRVVERVMSDGITLKQEGLLKHFDGPKSWCRSVGRGAGEPFTTSMTAASAGLCVLTPKPESSKDQSVRS